MTTSEPKLAVAALAAVPKECQWPNCMAEKEQKDLADEIYRALYSGEPAPVSGATSDELHFNAQRLRNVAKLVGLESAVPQDDATLDGARGSVLGQIAAKLRAAPAGTVARPDLTSLTRWSYNPQRGIFRHPDGDLFKARDVEFLFAQAPDQTTGETK